jgi:rhodanese-related sulfurtransferase/TusA-related sulfurtransferase
MTYGPSALTFDARGLACPMPIIRARKGIDTIEVGEVMEVLVTDRGAPADFMNWAKQTDQKFLGVVAAEGYNRLFVKKVVSETKEKGRTYPHEISNAALLDLVQGAQAPVILDVREEPEFQSGHIPGAVHVPIEEIEERIAALDPSLAYAVVCRSARRSDYACQIMANRGFATVHNVVPGMSGWTGPTER